MTDQAAPFSPNKLQPLIDSRAALARPIELKNVQLAIRLTCLKFIFNSTQRIVTSFVRVSIADLKFYWLGFNQASKSIVNLIYNQSYWIENCQIVGQTQSDSSPDEVTEYSLFKVYTMDSEWCYAYEVQHT